MQMFVMTIATQQNKKQQADDFSICFAVFVPDEQFLCVAFRVANNATIQFTHIITKFITFSQPSLLPSSQPADSPFLVPTSSPSKETSTLPSFEPSIIPSSKVSRSNAISSRFAAVNFNDEILKRHFYCNSHHWSHFSNLHRHQVFNQVGSPQVFRARPHPSTRVKDTMGRLETQLAKTRQQFHSCME
jgi:hypothetical protein